MTDLHRVGDEGDHLAHLHVAGIHGLAAEPDDEQAGAVHDKGHKGHHGDHGAVGEQLGAHQLLAGLVKALFLEGLAAERAHRHHAGQNLAADEVQLVHKGLHDLELRHRDVHQEHDEAEQQDHVQHDDPGKAGVALHDMEHTADAQDGRIGHHAQQDDADELHLLDVVGGAGDEGSGGEILNLCIGEMDDRGEGLPTQITADGSRHAGSDEAHQNGDRHHQQRQAQHLPAHSEEILHLDVVRDALRLVFQADQQGGLAGHAGKGRFVDLCHCAGKLLLDHLAGEARHLRHGRKLGAHGVQIGSSGGDGLRCGILGTFRGGCALSSPAGSSRILRKGSHALRGHPGAVGSLRSSHIQHDVRHGDDLFQRSTLLGGQVSAELQNAVILNVISVGVPEGLCILFTHQKRQRIPRGGAQGLGQGAFDAALLDAGIHDLARVVRQGKVAVRLHEQQADHDQAGGPVAGQLLEDLTHFDCLPSIFGSVPHFLLQWPPAECPSTGKTAAAAPGSGGGQCRKNTAPALLPRRRWRRGPAG